MTWGCLYDDNGFCDRLKIKCAPAVPGCVMHGKVKMLHYEGQTGERKNKTKKNKTGKTKR